MRMFIPSPKGWYTLEVNEQEFKDEFQIDYPNMSFNIRICVGAQSAEDAAKKVKKFLYDRKIRASIASQLHFNSRLSAAVEWKK